VKRLDKELLERGLVQSRSAAENLIKLRMVAVNKRLITKASFMVGDTDTIRVIGDQYVSRAALKLASIAAQFNVQFEGSTVLDVGSSTGGFTDYALQHGAAKVYAVDVGTNQLHKSLRGDRRIELYEKTDIRDFIKTKQQTLRQSVDIIIADVSFISLRPILPSLKKTSGQKTVLVMMCKPQFEAGKQQVNKGVIKNSAMRRQILKDFEFWLQDNGFIILDKADSQVAGSKGNVERFYKLKILE